jgi:RNA polymerase sigma factor (sigma-70 family)
MDEAFRDIYDRYYGDVRRFALFLTGDTSRADDLTADTFVRAWTARDRIMQTSVRAYLLTITRNLHRDQLRASRRLVPLEDTFVDRAPRADEHALYASSLRRPAGGRPWRPQGAAAVCGEGHVVRRGGRGARSQHRGGEITDLPRAGRAHRVPACGEKWKSR